MLYRVTFDPEPRPHCIQEVLNSSTGTHTQTLYNCIYMIYVCNIYIHISRMIFYCSNQQIEHWRGSHQNSSFELSTLFGSFHCAVGSASSGSQRFRRSWSCHQPLPRGPGFYSASVLSLPSHFKPLQAT